MNAPVSTLTSKGQVTIPKSIRDDLHLGSGDKVEFVLTETGEVVIKPVTRKASDVVGILKKYRQAKTVSVEEMNAAVSQRMKEHS